MLTETSDLVDNIINLTNTITIARQSKCMSPLSRIKAANGLSLPSSPMAFVKPDGSIFTVRTEDVLGIGQSGIILRRGEYALKIAKVRDTSGLTQEKRDDQEGLSDIAREILQNEKDVYQRLGRYPGIAECVELLQDGILLVFYSGGNVDHYISRNTELDWWNKKNWIMSIIKTVAYLHESRVLADDLALRNLVIADNFSLRMIDFGQCVILPLESDSSAVEVHGLTAKVDIFKLGCLIYSVAAWQRYETESLDLDPHLPPLENLPAINHLPCANIIRKCWSGSYANIDELVTEANRTFTLGLMDISSFWLHRCRFLLTSLQSSLPGGI